MRVSIITVTNNSEANLSSCINSVINQSYEDIDYIIIDNCSTDNTLDIAKSHVDYITRIVSEPDNGIFDAMNKGIRLADGDIIAFLHSDDFYANNTVIEDVVEAFSTHDCQSVYSDLQYVSKKNNDKVIRNWIAGEYKPESFAKGWMPPHPSFFVKKECYLKYGLYKTDYKIASDYELMLRFLYKHGISAFYINKVLVKMQDGGVSNKGFKNIIRKSKEDLEIIKSLRLGSYKTLVFKNLQKIKQFF